MNITDLENAYREARGRYGASQQRYAHARWQFRTLEKKGKSILAAIELGEQGPIREKQAKALTHAAYTEHLDKESAAYRDFCRYEAEVRTIEVEVEGFRTEIANRREQLKHGIE